MVAVAAIESVLSITSLAVASSCTLHTCTHQLGSILQPYYANFEGWDSKRSIGSRLLVGAGTVPDHSKTATEVLFGGYRPPRLSTVADLTESYLLLVAAVFGAKAQLLGKAVTDDAALRKQSVKAAFECSRTNALTKRHLPLGE